MVAKIPAIEKNKHFTDCHCHLVHGMDDGPSTTAESLEMAEILCSFGFSNIICTPHNLRGAYENEPDRVRGAVSALQDGLLKQSIQVTLRPSAEYHLDEYLFDYLNDPLPIEENIILLEIPPNLQPQLLSESAYMLITQNKMVPLLAHPERYDIFSLPSHKFRSPDISPGILSWYPKLMRKFVSDRYRHESDNLLTILKEMGCLFQGNVGSFAGIYGETVRKRAIQLLRAGVYDRLGTDAHTSKMLLDWLQEGMRVIRCEIDERTLAGLFGAASVAAL